MIRQTAFLAWWRDTCPRLHIGEAEAVFALSLQS